MSRTPEVERVQADGGVVLAALLDQLVRLGQGIQGVLVDRRLQGDRHVQARGDVAQAREVVALAVPVRIVGNGQRVWETELGAEFE